MRGTQGISVLRRRRASTEASLVEARMAAEDLAAKLAAATAGLEALSDGIAVFAPNGELAYLNGMGRDLIGRRFSTLDELAPPALREVCRAAAAAGNAMELEFETAGRTVHATVLVSGAKENGLDTVLILRDVTVSKRSDRVRRDFVANASHELKTPVASIAALAEALREATGRDEAASERFVALLQDESARLARLAGDLLDLSRLEGEMPERVAVSVHRVMAEETERLRPAAASAGLTFVVEPTEEVTVMGSESDLGLLVHNLLDNAIHYTPSGGEVRVTLGTKDGWADLRISDTGLGIASRDLDRIFERFYRSDPARSRQTGGTGLGLSIVKHVAEAHGGEVQVQSVLGAGSTFTVRLPVEGTETG